MSEYKRLTTSENKHRPYALECFKCFNKECNRCDIDYAVWERLAELEDKIEKGTLIELPCKVGDTVYRLLGGNDYDEWRIDKINIYIYPEKKHTYYCLVCSHKRCGIEYFYSDDMEDRWSFTPPNKEVENA